MSLKQSSFTDITNSFKNNGKSIEICDSFSSSDKINSRKEDISLIEDSTDGLQWFTELDYEYKSDEGSGGGFCRSVPKSIFESSLVVSSTSFVTPPTSNYSNHLDVNLAQIDIETFKTEDINTLFLQQAGEDCCPPLSESLFEDSISSKSTNGVEEQQNNFSLETSKIITEEEINRSNAKGKGVANDISVDSLDMSLFEKNTSKLLQKCTESDKNNYTIAFEGSLIGSQEFNALKQRKRSQEIQNKYELNFMSNEVNDRKMTKSEHLFRSLNKSQNNDRINRNLNHRSDLLVEDIDESIAKLTQSIPDIKALLKMNGNYRMPYTPVSGFIPLYELQSSQSSNSHSSSSEFSPPRSLVKMFMQNRSPLSSQPISPSFSYESRSQDSGAGNVSDLSYRPLYYNILELSREANNNILLENGNVSSAPTKDDSPLFDDNLAKNRNRFDSHRTPYDLKQTFPIKEVDENMWDSNNTDIQMNSIDGNETDLNRNPLKSNPKHRNPIYISKESNLSIKPVFEKCSKRTQMRPDSNSNSFETQFNSAFNVRNTDIRSTRILNQQKYSSSGNTRTMSTQFPIHFQDKEVQASIQSNVNPIMTPTMTPLMTPESPNDCNKPFYVYYPNYSLPDLSFLEQIFEKHSNCGPKTVYLSPTKHQMPKKDSYSVRMRGNTKSKSRPKSYTDFETLSKQNFSHIKDWDSLNILLPNEFKELMQKAKNMSNVEKQTTNENIFNDCNSNVRMRSHRSSSQLTDNSLYSRRGYVRNKRYSLQEYPSSQTNDIQIDCHNNSHNIQHNSCITRSQTMPNCHNSCHCHQHCCHSCCHSCCRTPRQSPSTSTANNPFVQSSNLDINTNSIDKLCQLLAMDLSFKKLMNIINGPTVGPHKRSNFETVAESKEEKSLESDINHNNNNSIPEELVQNHSANELPNKESVNFKELKQRWESLAAISPTDVKTMTTISEKSNSLENSKRLGTQSQKSRPKPQIPRKPQVVLRRPQSSIPRPTTLNTENPIYSHRKSLIPVPKAGIKSPVNYTPKLKTNIGSKNTKL